MSSSELLMPGREELRGKQGGLPRLGHHGPLGKWRGAVVKDFQAVVPTVVGRQTQDKPTEGQLEWGWGRAKCPELQYRARC